MVRWTCLGKRYTALEYKMDWYALYFRIFFPERNDCKRILNLNIAPQSNFVIIKNTFPDWLLLCTCLRNKKQEKGYLNVPNHYKTKEFLALHKIMENLGISGDSFVYGTKFCVLNRNIGHKQLALFGFPFSFCCEDQFDVISSVLSQGMRKVYRAMSPS